MRERFLCLEEREARRDGNPNLGIPSKRQSHQRYIGVRRNQSESLLQYVTPRLVAMYFRRQLLLRKKNEAVIRGDVNVAVAPAMQLPHEPSESFDL